MEIVVWIIIGVVALWLLGKLFGSDKTGSSTSEKDFYSAIRSSSSEFDAGTWFNGKELKHDQGDGFLWAKHKLRANIHNETKNLSAHQIYVKTQWGGKTSMSKNHPFLEKAQLEGGQSLNVTQIKYEKEIFDQDEPGFFGHTMKADQIIGVNLDLDDLRAKKSKGFKVRIATRTGDKSVTIEYPANYVAAWIKKIDEQIA